MIRPCVARLVSVVTAALVLSSTSLRAQDKTPPSKPRPMGAMESGKMEEMDHANSGWKELDAFHHLLMDTWHPAQGKNDLAPTRAKAAEMAAQAKVLAASTTPKGCETATLKATLAKLVPESQNVADLVVAKADDPTLKKALSSVHTLFEVLEMGCQHVK